MAANSMVERIQDGMHVKSSDGVDLGRITEVWVGTDPASGSGLWDEEVCSRIEVHRGRRGRGATMYIPYNMIADVTGKEVVLRVDSEAVKSKAWAWHMPPDWIPTTDPLSDIDRLFRPR